MTSTDPVPSRSELFEANEQAARFYHQQLLDAAGAGPRSYLEARGFPDLPVDGRWTVGYAPAGWTSLRDRLLGQGFSSQALHAAGLVSITRRGQAIDHFRDRLTFGIRGLQGDLVGFTARAAPAAGNAVPKYVNTPRTALYDKGATLFGLGEQADRLRNGHDLVLVEGPLDALAVDSTTTVGSSRLAAVALCGTAFTERHASVLTNLVKAQVILALDADQPGIKAAETVYDKLRRERATVFAANLPDGSDPADTLATLGSEQLRRCLTEIQPLSDWIVDRRLRTWPNIRENAEAQIACLRDIARAVSRMTPEDATPASTTLARHPATRARNRHPRTGRCSQPSEPISQGSPTGAGQLPRSRNRTAMI